MCGLVLFVEIGSTGHRFVALGLLLVALIVAIVLCASGENSRKAAYCSGGAGSVFLVILYIGIRVFAWYHAEQARQLARQEESDRTQALVQARQQQTWSPITPKLHPQMPSMPENQAERQAMLARVNVQRQQQQQAAQPVVLRQQEDVRRQLEANERQLKERLEREKSERDGPDPSDPEYHSKLVDRMLSGNHAYRQHAMAVLLQTEPGQVDSSETRKKIARAFRQLATENRTRAEGSDAVKGLVHWAGKYSVPVLLEILAMDRSFSKPEVFKALGDLKDEQAVDPVAARLSDNADRSDAINCLRKMGPMAENAVIAMLASSDRRVCVAAIELLGDIGAKKSVGVLRPAAAKSRYPQVRFAAQSALAKIAERRGSQAKSDEEQKKQQRQATGAR